jgi:hypothetical protein
MAEARRTLVKSPPELWAEISDPESLAKHLGAFGEIRITRTEPETTVAWEGDRARGTVELEASGWGTKVRLTAETVEEPALQQPLAAPADGDTPAAEPAPEEAANGATEPPLPGADEPAAEQPVTAAARAAVEQPAVEEPVADAAARAAVEGPAVEEPVAEEPVAEKPVAEKPAAEKPVAEPPPPKRRGLFARLFGRREVEVVAVEEPEVAATEEPEVAATEEPAEKEPVVEAPPPAPDVVAVEEPEVVAVEEPEVAAVDEPAADVAPVEEVASVEEPADGDITVARIGDDEAAKVLDAVLDTLGAAHHRPFSRS